MNEFIDVQNYEIYDLLIIENVNFSNQLLTERRRTFRLAESSPS